MGVFAITGPTGSGKTDLAIEIAQRLSLPLFNADPFQFYRELPIIGNQPNNTRGQTIEWTGFRSIKDPMTAGDFARLAKSKLNQDSLWVGTGLYLGAALYGLDEDRRKGVPFQGKPLVDYRMIVVSPSRERLYARLNERVDEMLKAGALSEAQSIKKLLDESNALSNLPALKAIGLRHLLLALNGETSLERAIELWKRDTRRLAKRQWTWLRKFCAPKANCLWLEEAHLDRALDFFSKT